MIKQGLVIGALYNVQPDVTIDQHGYKARQDLFGSGMGFRLDTRWLLLAKKGMKRPEVTETYPGFLAVKWPLSRRHLAETVGRTLYYPPGLIRGACDRTVELFITIYKKRMMATYGSWYGAS